MYTIKLTPQQAESIYWTMIENIRSQADVSLLSELNAEQESLFKAELHVIKEITKNF